MGGTRGGGAQRPGQDNRLGVLPFSSVSHKTVYAGDCAKAERWACLLLLRIPCTSHLTPAGFCHPGRWPWAVEPRRGEGVGSETHWALLSSEWLGG